MIRSESSRCQEASMADTGKTRKLGKGLAGLIGVPVAVPVPAQVDPPGGEDNTEYKKNINQQTPTYELAGLSARPGGAAAGGRLDGARTGVGGVGGAGVVVGTGGHAVSAADVPGPGASASPSGARLGVSAGGAGSGGGAVRASLAAPLTPPGGAGAGPARAVGAAAGGASEESGSAAMPYVVVRVEEVVANRFQPRQEFERAGLELLAASIKRDGVMQPLVVRRVKPTVIDGRTGVGGTAGGGAGAAVGLRGPLPNGGGSVLGDAARRGGTPLPHEGAGARWELVAGERRLRAAQMAGLTHVPAVVVDVPDLTAAMWAVVENVQRVDLGPLEKSHAYARLAKEFGLTQAEIAEQVGEDRTLVSHYIRVSELEPAVKEMVRARQLTFGHAKALNSPLVQPGDARVQLAEKVVREALSVRQLELLVQAGAGKSLEAVMSTQWSVNGPVRGRPTVGGERIPLPGDDDYVGAGIIPGKRGGGESGGAGGDGAARSAAAAEHARAVQRAAEFEERAGVRDLEERIGKHLGTKVRIRTSGGGKRGVVSIEFFSLDHFEGLMAKLGVGKEG